jgi:ribose-phosphate pyrophosphokinase
MILHLDEGFRPTKYGQEKIHDVKSFVFNGGECHVKLEGVNVDKAHVTLTARLNTSDDVMKVLLANDALRRGGCNRVKLFVPYFPYARQDRVMVPGEPLSVKVMARLINSCNFDEVISVDVHSDVTSALVNNMRVVSNKEFIGWVVDKVTADIIEPTQQFVLVSPDAGALKKVVSLNLPYHIAVGVKSRDVSTGKLTSLAIYGDVAGKVCLIIDDICDGGRTFVGLGTRLLDMGAKEVNLAVTHGIFSQGFGVFKGIINNIYTTNSIKSAYEGASVYALSL